MCRTTKEYRVYLSILKITSNKEVKIESVDKYLYKIFYTYRNFPLTSKFMLIKLIFKSHVNTFTGSFVL